MKTKTILLTVGLLLATVSTARSQTDANPEPLVIQTMYLNQDLANQNVNLDSLLVVYKKNILDPNPNIKNSKILRHWWGNDSRQVVLLFELDEFSRIQQAFQQQQQLTEDYLEKNPEFERLWGQAMNQSHHADEIYRVVNSSR